MCVFAQFLLYSVLLIVILADDFPHELLSPDEVERIEGLDGLEELSFTVFGEYYRIKLRNVESPVHRNIELVVDDRLESLGKDDVLYEGFVVGKPNETVTVTVISSKFLILKINKDNDTIHVEPAHLKIYDNESDLLAYKGSDCKKASRLSPNYHQNYINDIIGPIPTVDTYKPSRSKREATEIPVTEKVKKNRCPLKIVADYKFFELVGKKNIAHTTRYIMNMVSKVNEIFLSVDWDKGNENDFSKRGRFVNMGFTIKKIQIHKYPDRQRGHYNGRPFSGSLWNTSDLLVAFTKKEGSSEFCLVHLLTAQIFEDFGVLGLSYIAARDISQGGICVPSDKSGLTYNTLFTTVRGGKLEDVKNGYPLVTRETEIVVAHEYGHSWGAVHDNVDLDANGTKLCTPNFENGGLYIMYYISQLGNHYNNDKFSPCSILNIRKVLEARYSWCFEEEVHSLCGNGIVEKFEDCDEGRLPGSSNSTCCTSDCKFRPNARCSPHNQPCCSNQCDFHNSTHICLQQYPWLCKAESYCTGLSGECPPPPALPDNSVCEDDGECRKGECVPFCEKSTIGKTSCLCDDLELACQRCCRDMNGTGQCLPELGAPVLKDNTICAIGRCKNAKCVSASADLIMHKLPFETNHSFFLWFGRNVVVGIVILALAIWIPCSIFVHNIDQRKKRAGRKANKVEPLKPKPVAIQ